MIFLNMYRTHEGRVEVHVRALWCLHVCTEKPWEVDCVGREGVGGRGRGACVRVPMRARAFTVKQQWGERPKAAARFLSVPLPTWRYDRPGTLVATLVRLEDKVSTAARTPQRHFHGCCAINKPVFYV